MVYRYAPSESHGPFPTALLLHGCAGDKDHLAGRGRLLARHGHLVYTIDSLSPRNISSLQARCLVCTGLMLQGKKRSRDLTESISIALQDPMVATAMNRTFDVNEPETGWWTWIRTKINGVRWDIRRAAPHWIIVGGCCASG